GAAGAGIESGRSARGEPDRRCRCEPISRHRRVARVRLSRNGGRLEAERAHHRERVRHAVFAAEKHRGFLAAAARLPSAHRGARRAVRHRLRGRQRERVRDLLAGHQLLGARAPAAQRLSSRQPAVHSRQTTARGRPDSPSTRGPSLAVDCGAARARAALPILPRVRYAFAPARLAPIDQPHGEKLAMYDKLRVGVVVASIAVAVSACGKKEEPAADGAEPPVLNLYIWNDYLADDTISNFEKEFGIKVSVTNFGSNEELDSKLAPGNSGYDVVVPSASAYERQIQAGYYQKLDKSLLPNLSNMDPEIQARLALQDPNNVYAVLHMWGTTGIGYNEEKIKAAMKDAPVDSWRLVFDPNVVKNFQKCGVAVLDSATEM